MLTTCHYCPATTTDPSSFLLVGETRRMDTLELLASTGCCPECYEATRWLEGCDEFDCLSEGELAREMARLVEEEEFAEWLAVHG